MSLPLPEIPIESYQTKIVQYQLQQLVHSPNLRVIENYDATSVSKAEEFNAFCKKLEQKNIVHVFIPLPELLQPLSDICKRGVRVNPRKGLKLHIDHVHVNPELPVLEFAHCLVALGKTQNHQMLKSDPDTETYESSNPLPEQLLDGFNSFRINDNPEFWVFNPAQVRTLQIIRTTSGDTLTAHPQFEALCDLCKKEKATIWCVNCAACLCEDCNRESHSGNSVLESHARIPFDKAGCYMETCPFHPGNKVEHYCPTCHLPVCYECKLTGNHSQGVYVHHHLIPLSDAYVEAIKKSNVENRNYGRRRRLIAAKIRDADERLKNIALNQRTVEDRIMEEAKKAIESLREQAGYRSLCVRSARQELIRKQKELEDWTDFLETTRELSGPVGFIQAVSIHNDLASSDLKQDYDIPPDLYVQGDLCLTGGLHVKPRQLAEIPEDVKKRDIDFEEENVRITDYPTTVDTIPPSTVESRSYTYTTNGGWVNKGESKYPKTKQIKLSQLSERKEQKVLQSGKKLHFKPFDGSQIVTDDAKRHMLYFCFPFKGLPEPQLLYSTERDGKSMRIMHKLVDNIGITAVLVKRGNLAFGGFAAVKWRADGEPFGEGSSTFLFQINKDAFIPYRPNTEDACTLIADRDYISFGRYDLRLENDFNNCSSHLENSYTYGLGPGSVEADTFLA